MIKAAIFDMDGTVTNTLPTITNVVNRLMSEEGLAPYSEEDMKYMVGNGYKNLIQRAVTGRNGDISRLKALQDRYLELYSADYLTGSYIYDGIVDVLTKLKENGVKIAVLSNRPDVQTQYVINALFGENFFDMTCGAVDEFPLKPDTAYLKHILKALDVTPKEALYFGDTSTDMQTGKGGGLYTVGVLWGFRKQDELEAAGADAIIDKTEDIASFLNR